MSITRMPLANRSWGQSQGQGRGGGQENKLNKSLRDPPVNREIGRQACLKTLPSRKLRHIKFNFRVL